MFLVVDGWEGDVEFLVLYVKGKFVLSGFVIAISIFKSYNYEQFFKKKFSKKHEFYIQMRLLCKGFQLINIKASISFGKSFSVGFYWSKLLCIIQLAQQHIEFIELFIIMKFLFILTHFCTHLSNYCQVGKFSWTKFCLISGFYHPPQLQLASFKLNFYWAWPSSALACLNYFSDICLKICNIWPYSVLSPGFCKIGLFKRWQNF